MDLALEPEGIGEPTVLQSLGVSTDLLPLPVSSIGKASGVSCSCPEPSGSKQDCAAHSGGLRSAPER